MQIKLIIKVVYIIVVLGICAQARQIIQDSILFQEEQQ